jgi:hypothetical protein
MRIKLLSSTNVRLIDVAIVSQLATIGSVLLVLCGTILWIISLKEVDIRRMSDLGLVSVLPASIFVAVIMLIASLALTLHQQPLRVPVLLLQLVVIVFMLYGVTSVVEETPRTSIVWKLMGITEYIMRTGSIDSKIDAFFNWPGFFILGAFLASICGFRNVVSFAMWAPVFFNLLYLGPLIMILSSASEDKRLVWLGVLFFYLTNWIGQDYLAPQALNYFFYLIVLGILLKWFKMTNVQLGPFGDFLERFGRRSRRANSICRWLTPIDKLSTSIRPGQRVGLMSIIIILCVVVVSSHQLTPFAILISVVLLVAFNRCTARGLPILIVVLVGTWISFMTVSYLAGHTAHVTAPVGSLGDNIHANLTGRFRGSAEHRFINYLRIVMTVVLWGLALLGAIRRLRKGYSDLIYVLLAIAPFPLLALQAYGGELLMRLYLFALPFVVFFAAAFFYTTPAAGHSWLTTVLVGLVSAALVGGFFFTRYGNERMNYFTANEINGVRYLYSVAEPGSQLLAARGVVPWKFQDYTTYRYVTIESIDQLDVDTITHLMKNKRYLASYLILTRSQQASAELYDGWSPDLWQHFARDLADSGELQVLYSNEDAAIFTLANGGDQAK